MSNYQGSSKVSPDKQTVNGRLILGWAVGSYVQGKVRTFSRRWVELFHPLRLDPGQEAVPLVDGRELPEAAAAPPAAPVAPPAAPAGPVSDALALRVKEVRKACRMNINAGSKAIDPNWVLKMLTEDEPQQS